MFPRQSSQLTLGGFGWLFFVSLIPALVACSPPAEPGSERPSVVVYLLDAARADYFSSYGHGVETTPRMDAIAADGTRFARHFSNASVTAYSVPQLFTARYDAPPLLLYPPGWKMPWWARDEVPAANVAVLSSVLSESGYRTVNVTTHPWTTAASRFGRSFDATYELRNPRGYAPADAVFGRALEAIEEHRREHRGRPLFLYVHILDTHTPHNGTTKENPFFSLEKLGWSHEEWIRRQPGIEGRRYYEDPPPALVEAFRGATRYSYHSTDEHLGRFHDEATRLLGPETVHVITSDHGDAMGEHGWFEHGLGTFGSDALHHIPLIIKSEGLVPKGEVVEEMTATVDVMPTILDLLGVPLPPRAEVDGRSLAALMSRPEASGRPMVPFVFRLGWQRSRFAFRDAEHATVLSEYGELFRSDGSLRFLPAELRPDELAANKQRFLEAYRVRDRSRRFEPLARGMYVPPFELHPSPWPPPPCWHMESRRQRDQMIYRPPPGDTDVECGRLQLTVELPAGSYRWSLEVPKSERAELEVIPRLGGGAVHLTAAAAEAGSIFLGDLDHPGGAHTFQLLASGPGALMVGGLQFTRRDLEGPDDLPEVDPETIEQLKSLGYL